MATLHFTLVFSSFTVVSNKSFWTDTCVTALSSVGARATVTAWVVMSTIIKIYKEKKFQIQYPYQKVSQGSAQISPHMQKLENVN